MKLPIHVNNIVLSRYEKLDKIGSNGSTTTFICTFNINLVVLFLLLVNDLGNYKLGNILPLCLIYQVIIVGCNPTQNFYIISML